MKRSTKAALITSQAAHFDLRVAFFHATPVLDRRRRTHWDSRPNYYSRRYRKLNSKQELLRNVGAFAEHIFQSWQFGEEYDPSSSQSSWWFRRDYGPKGSNGSRNDYKGHCAGGRRVFEFCEDDDEVETIFQSAFGGDGHYFWSFVDEGPQKRWSGYYNGGQRNSQNWRHQSEEEYKSSNESDGAGRDFTADRLALGLSGCGPLSLEDVKKAYRKCALKWHPDRHEGSSKAFAEEKFKACSAAYQSICDKLAVV